jgi:predicted nuclease of predicted toxin-antitoxin system
MFGACMRFLVDECTGPVVAEWLRQQVHDVFSVFEQARGLDDDAVLQQACVENRIIVTNDKDFGDMVFRDQRPHRGIILLRLVNLTPSHQIAALSRVLAQYPEDQLIGRFVVVTEASIRIV